MANNGKSEKKILQMIISEYSWEQVLYKIIAWEGLDPWDLDIIRLSNSFMTHIADARDLDFRLPAKYVLIASVLLRMKSDYLRIIRQEEMEAALEEPGMEQEVPAGETEAQAEMPRLVLNEITVPPKRMPKRKIVVTELVAALRRTLASQERRERKLRARGKIEIAQDDIAERIESLYGRISEIMSRMKADEVKFSGVVKKWNRVEIIDTFLPLIHLNHQRRIDCRQEELFKEILIRKPGRAG
jgi:segregation and condensation protein A